MKQWLKKNRIFLMFFVSFLMVIAVPVCALSVVRRQSVHSIQQEVMRNNEALLMQCEQDVENVLSIVDNSLMSLAFNENILAFVSEPRTYAASPNLIKVKNVATDISSYNHLFDFSNVLELIVYSGMSDAVVTHRASYSRAPLYFQSSLLCGEDSPGYLDLLRSSPTKSLILPAANVTLFSNPRTVLTMVRPIMKNYRASGYGNLVALIDAAKFTDILGKMNLGDTGFALIAGEDGQVLVQVGGSEAARYAHLDEIDIDEREFILLTDRANSKRSYIAYVPRQIALSEVTYIGNMIVITTAVEISLSVLLAVLLSYRNAKPILEIFSIVRRRDSGREKAYNYDFLKGTVSSIVQENDALRQRVGEQTHVMRSELVRKLISGTIFDLNEIHELAEHANMNLSGACYALLSIRNTTYGNMVNQETLSALENARILLKAQFERRADIRAYSYDGNMLETVMLIVFPAGGAQSSERTLEEAVRQIDERLTAGYNLSLQYICGGFCKQLLDLPELYTSLRLAPAQSGQEMGGALRYASEKSASALMYYPLYEETRLIKAVSLCQSDVSASIIRKIYAENAKVGGAAATDLPLLGKCIYLTVVRICESMARSEDILLAAAFLLDVGEIPADALAEATVALFDQICSIKSTEMKDSQTRILDEIVAYIQENVGNSMFSLYDVSVRFNYTEAYLYKLLRENTNRTFAATLEKLRMERACRLLMENELSIEEIASQCGYNSAHAFRRAFKKNMSMLPTEYREVEFT